MDFFSFFGILIIIYFTRKWIHSFFPEYISTDKKSILITGCDSGFGYELAIKAKEQGFHVFACCLSQSSDGAASLADKDCHVIEVDVTKQETIDAALLVVEEVLTSKGLILHGVVNNAGINLTLGSIEWIEPETIEKVLDVNTMGVVRVTRTFLPLVRKAKGRIVNICSMAAHFAVPRLIPYCMSKGATFMYTNGLRRELKAFGVYVSSISPIFYRTAITAKENVKLNLETSWSQASPPVQEAYGGATAYNAMMTKIERGGRGNRHQTWEVTDCILDALRNPNPKPDYIPDIKSRILAAVVESLPLSWADASFDFVQRW